MLQHVLGTTFSPEMAMPALWLSACMLFGKRPTSRCLVCESDAARAHARCLCVFCLAPIVFVLSVLDEYA